MHEDTKAGGEKKRVGSRLRRLKFPNWKIISTYLVIYDIVAINVSYFAALMLRFDLHYSSIPEQYRLAFLKFVPIYTVFAVAVFGVLHLYNSLWSFASFSELNHILAASAITCIFHAAGITVFYTRMPVSYYVFGTVIQVVLITCARFGYRFVNMERRRHEHNSKEPASNVMVIGAGAAGQAILRELKSTKEIFVKPCCVIDDDENKWGCFIEGVLIVGGRDSILESVEKYQIDQILFAIPTATPQEKRDFLNICKEAKCELKSLPGMYQLANGEVTLSSMKPVAVEDLLGREPIKVNMDEIFQHLKGKTILVTGGGGSIGSELCRQIAGHKPKQLIIFDIYENSAYEIQQELRRKYGDKLNLVVLIGSVRDSRRVDMIFEQYRPDIVYHAAAHKHVPLMEGSPNEAIKNNVIGTYKTAYAALKYGTKRFVLISTDKAVNPTSVMGASKRICEMVIQSMDAVSRAQRMDILPFVHAHQNKMIDGQLVPDPMDHMAADGMEEAAAANIYAMDGKQDSPAADLQVESVKEKKGRAGTQFVAVRFGNVLGSNGSVLPLFRKQIEEGGPVTVTHPDIIRYFMTISEAVSLVLQAGTYAWGGEIFVLDMGEQVKIDTLARNLIKLSGYEPDVDIPIIYTGLRSGEKLYEERLMEEEGLKQTENEKIHIGKPIPFDVETFLGQLEQLAKASYDNSSDIVELVKQVVPTFHPSGENPTGAQATNQAMREAAATMV